MRRSLLLVLLAGVLSVEDGEARGRGHASAAGFGSFRQAGPSMGRGIGGHRIGRPGAVGFGFGKSGPRIGPSWPFYGWGFGTYYAPVWPVEYDAALDSEGTDSAPAYYYQKPPESNIKPNCQESSWTGKGSPSSLSHFMDKVFELQCQNRHPEAQPKPSSSLAPAKN